MRQDSEIVPKSENQAVTPPAHNVGCKTPPKNVFLADESPPLLSPLDKLVTAERLLEIVWDEASRPSLQWIRKETKRRMIPHIRRGRLIFYRPRSVMQWYAQRESRPASMK